MPPVHHYAATSVDQYLEKGLRYARTEALELTADELDPLVFWRTFYKLSIVDEGWRDGFPGLVFLSVLAFTRAISHAYAWELLGHPSVPLMRRGRRVNSTYDIRKLFSDQMEEPLFEYALEKVDTDPIREVGSRVRQALRYKPSLLLHPTTTKAALKYGGIRLANRAKRLRS